MNEIRHRAVSFLYCLFFAFIIVHFTQLGLGLLLDWHIAYPWNRISFVVITILLWSPWRKLNLPKNQGNNDLFPG